MCFEFCPLVELIWSPWGRFKNMSDAEWDQVQLVHLKGAFSCTKAAWPIFRKQKFGRVVNTASAAGLYGSSQYCVVSRGRLLTLTLCE